MPLLLRTSLMYHCPSSHQSSQCLRETTFDLNPTGAAEGVLLAGSVVESRSEYRPTLITDVGVGSVRVIGGKMSDGRAERGSWWGINRIVGSCDFGVAWSVLSDCTFSPVGDVDNVCVVPSVCALVLVMAAEGAAIAAADDCRDRGGEGVVCDGDEKTGSNA